MASNVGSPAVPIRGQTPATGEASELRISLEDRRTPELVIALVGPVGSGVSTCATLLKNILQRTYKYDRVDIHRVSDIIRSSAPLVGINVEANAQGAERISKLQQAGDRLRQNFSNAYLAEKCVDLIAAKREEGGYPKSLALSLHTDAITDKDVVDGQRKVIFLQYEGTAPRNMLRLFQHETDRKRSGAVIERDPSVALPVFPPPLDGFSHREQMIVAKLKKEEDAAQSAA